MKCTATYTGTHYGGFEDIPYSLTMVGTWKTLQSYNFIEN
jgi:hypothetical protein